MPTLTFPDYRPSFQGTSKSTKPKVIKNDFGDGYSQRTADGLNFKPQDWGVSFEGFKVAEINTIESFLDDHGGYIAFWWTPERGSTSKKFICPEWTRTFIAEHNDNLTAKFEEVSDL